MRYLRLLGIVALISTALSVISPLTAAEARAQMPSTISMTVADMTTYFPCYHWVRAGETFRGIAAMYGLTFAELQALNPSVNPDYLNIGQRLRLEWYCA